jgi:hypothetical protein
MSTSRKDFLKKLALGIGSMVVPENAQSNNTQEEIKLTHEQIDFLKNYENWLVHFREYVNKRNIDPLNFENNKKLMELSAEAESRKPTLEKYMQDEIFALYFNHITKEITEAI